VPKPQPVCLALVGPSGSGKDSVLEKLRSRHRFHLVVTATTRPPRPNEVDGRDYMFVSRERFLEWQAQGQLLEHAEIYGEWFGVPRAQVSEALASGLDVVLRINHVGAAAVRAAGPPGGRLVVVVLQAESEVQLARRLVARGTESLEQIAGRLRQAQRDGPHMLRMADYVLVNREGGLEQCAAQLEAIMVAERARVRQGGREQGTGGTGGRY